MGSDVSFISIVGDDEIGRFGEKELKKAKVKTSLYVDPTRPTTFKKRYRSNGKSLLRVSYLHQTAISSELQDKVYESALKIMGKVDLLIFSDFNYGCLPQRLVTRLIELAKKHNVFVAADSQSSSQYGDISRYRGMDLITPTEREARISTRNQEDGLVVLAEILKKNSNAKNILLKLGSQGVLIHSSPENIWVTDQIEALNKMALDVAGAGDSLLVASALAIAVGANIWEAAYIGSLAASIQVGRVGNTPIRQNELIERV
jgi:rfaE bifunctional protein kinase chain/domain